MKRFEGKHAIVTGAAQGIGRATALQLAAEGAVVTLVDRVAPPCEEIGAQIEQAGGRAAVIQADLETHDGACEMVRRAQELCGDIDVSVHNVGGTIWTKPYWEYSGVEIEREISRSLWPTMWCCHEIVKAMLPRGRGAIVNVGSAVTRGGLYRVPYAAAKGGVHAMTLCLANDLADSGLRVNCVAPGPIDNTGRVIPRNPSAPTAQERVWMQELYDKVLADTPLNRYGQPDEVAAAICFLASDQASYITGQLLSVAGGGTA